MKALLLLLPLKFFFSFGNKLKKKREEHHERSYLWLFCLCSWVSVCSSWTILKINGFCSPGRFLLWTHGKSLPQKSPYRGGEGKPQNSSSEPHSPYFHDIIFKLKKIVLSSSIGHIQWKGGWFRGGSDEKMRRICLGREIVVIRLVLPSHTPEWTRGYTQMKYIHFGLFDQIAISLHFIISTF